jgi:hypothetical protein
MSFNRTVSPWQCRDESAYKHSIKVYEAKITFRKDYDKLERIVLTVERQYLIQDSEYIVEIPVEE